MPSDALRILIADNEPLARDLVRRYVQAHADLEVVAECRTGDELATALARVRPDVALLDVRMPGTDVFTVLEREAVSAHPLPAVVPVHRCLNRGHSVLLAQPVRVRRCRWRWPLR